MTTTTPSMYADVARRAAIAGTAALLALLVCLALASRATAATTIATEPFGSSWTPGSTWTTGGTTTPSIATNNAWTPTSALRLTPAVNSQSGYVMYNLAQPTAGGLDISFKLAQWGNTVGSGADGITFFLRKGTETSTQPGALGGAMGYSTFPSGNQAGLPGGLIGIGFDLYGAFAGQSQFGGGNCAGDGTGGSISANRIAVRGPGSGTSGYCRLAVTNAGAVAFNGGTNSRAGRARSVRITVDPATQANPRVKVYYVGDGSGTGLTQVLDFAAPAQLISEPTIKFGFAAGTGGWNNNHEIWGLTVESLVDLPPVTITTTTLPTGTVGTAYTCTPIQTADAVAPATLSISAGSLPPGLTFNPTTAEVCGTPTTEGSTTFTVEVTDGRGPTPSTATRAYTIPVADSGPPCVPVDLTATAGAREASVGWKPNPDPSCPGVKRYEVQTESGETCATVVPIATCTITGLGDGVPVRFRVRALNDVGASDWSSYTEAVTTAVAKAAKPLPPVTIVDAVGGGTTIAATVRSPAPGHAILLGTAGGKPAFTPDRHVFAKPGTATLSATLNARIRALLRMRDVRVRITVRLVTRDGRTATSTRIITLTKIAYRPPSVTG